MSHTSETQSAFGEVRLTNTVSGFRSGLCKSVCVVRWTVERPVQCVKRLEKCFLMKQSCSATSTSLKTPPLLGVRVCECQSPSDRDVELHADLLFIWAQDVVRMSENNLE